MAESNAVVATPPESESAVLAGVVTPAGSNRPAARTAKAPEVEERDGKFYVGSKEFRTAKAAQDALALFLELAAATKIVPVKPEAVKAAARVALANALVKGYAATFAALPDDDPILAALGGRATAAQDAANWIHHLPVVKTGEAWDIPDLPVPARSNWVDGKRK